MTTQPKKEKATQFTERRRPKFFKTFAAPWQDSNIGLRCLLTRTRPRKGGRKLSPTEDNSSPKTKHLSNKKPRRKSGHDFRHINLDLPSYPKRARTDWLVQDVHIQALGDLRAPTLINHTFFSKCERALTKQVRFKNGRNFWRTEVDFSGKLRWKSERLIHFASQANCLSHLGFFGQPGPLHLPRRIVQLEHLLSSFDMATKKVEGRQRT